MVGRVESGGLQHQVNTLTGKLEALHANKYNPDPAVETIQNIILGRFLEKEQLNVYLYNVHISFMMLIVASITFMDLFHAITYIIWKC